jgi:deoxyribose-phosphate aldolase
MAIARRDVLAASIDHTLLRAETSGDDIRRLCEDARRHGFAAVCINPVWVGLARDLLSGSSTVVATVCSFPLGASVSAVKVAETAQAADDGASEIDMVMNIGAALTGEWGVVEDDVGGVVEAASLRGARVKVILECGLLSDEQKIEAARRSVATGAAFVKTSTGMLAGGATVHDVALLRRTVGINAGVKTSGSIRTLVHARAMLAAGANRLGTSSGSQILDELRELEDCGN